MINTKREYEVAVSGYRKGSREYHRQIHIVTATTRLKAQAEACKQAREEWAFFTCGGVVYLPPTKRDFVANAHWLRLPEKIRMCITSVSGGNRTVFRVPREITGTTRFFKAIRYLCREYGYDLPTLGAILILARHHTICGKDFPWRWVHQKS